MPADSIAIKHNNHRIHPCPNDKKIELLNLLISQNKTLNIVIVSSENIQNIQNGIENKEIPVMDDKKFLESKELTCDMLISYDVPDKAIIYIAMVSKATQKAVLLVDENEQNKLYPIEILLGRAIKQEIVKGFEYEVKEVLKAVPQRTSKTLSKDEIKEVARKRYNEHTSEKKSEEFFDKKPKKEYSSDKKKEFKKDFKKEDKKPFDKSKKFDKKPYDKSEKYDKKPFDKSEKFDKNKKKNNKFLGKDENGKAIFSGKSGDRNHRYDGTPKEAVPGAKKTTGKKIQIKSIKKPKES